MMSIGWGCCICSGLEHLELLPNEELVSMACASEKLEEQDRWSLHPAHVLHEAASGPSFILTSQGTYEGDKNGLVTKVK